MRARTLLVTTSLLTALALAGCAERDDDASGSAPTPTPTATGSEPTASATATEPAGQVVEITIEGHDVTPKGETVDVSRDEPVVIEVHADAPGELHVHSTPEQQIAYQAGHSTHELTFERPGRVEIESHDLHVVIVQLNVR